MTAYDAYGNVATGYTGTVSFTSSDSQAALPAELHVRRRRRGHAYLLGHAQDGGDAVDHGDRHVDLTSPARESGIVVKPAAASIAESHRLPDQRHGGHVWHNFTVTAYDPYGNVATGYTGHGVDLEQRLAGGPAVELHVRRRRRRHA